MTRATSSQNKILTYSDSNGDSNASVSSSINITTGHKVSWEMKFNTAFMNSRTPSQNQATATHEFGHTIGLGNLSNATLN